MYRLTNTIRDYAWGSPTAIPELLGEAADGRPQAEMWLGAHPGAPSRATGHGAEDEPLDRLVSADPEGLLGAEAADRFGRLPFLTKVLAAEQPLSLQVHPTLEQARARFEAEEASGVDRGAPDRNYRDDNHKPELIFALTDFAALCGFRPAAESAALFERLAAVVGPSASTAAERTAALLRGGDLRGAFTGLLAGGAEVRELLDAAPAAVAADPSAAADPGLAELPSLARHYPGDPGALVSLLLNHVRLKPGQAMYLPAGNIHAYLRGLGVEVMASSDNVLRGGLTSKHVDLPELLDTVEFASLGVPLLEATTNDLGQEIYRPPFDEFQLQRIALGDPGRMDGGDVPVAQNGPVVLVCVEGELLLDSPRGDERVGRGQSVFIPAAECPVVARRLGDGRATAFAVTLP